MSFTALKTIRPFFTNDCGRLLAGGKVYSYEPGTLTPKPTYKDAAGLTENTNPVILDASGEADIYINSDYRFQIFDRDGVLIDDVDFVAATQRVSSEFVLDASGLTQGQINNDVRLEQGQALNPTAAWPDVLSLINQNGAPSIHDVPIQALLNRIQKLYEDAVLLSNAVADRYTKTEANTLFIEAAQIGQPNGVAGLDANGDLDPSQFPLATETTAGKAKIATTAIAQAGENDTDFITPLKLKNSVFGLGQTWQNVTANRVIGTTYTNTTGKPIFISVRAIPSSGGTAATTSVTISINGNPVSSGGSYGSDSTRCGGATAVVLSGDSYSVTLDRMTYTSWWELR